MKYCPPPHPKSGKKSPQFLQLLQVHKYQLLLISKFIMNIPLTYLRESYRQFQLAITIRCKLFNPDVRVVHSTYQGAPYPSFPGTTTVCVCGNRIQNNYPERHTNVLPQLPSCHAPLGRRTLGWLAVECHPWNVFSQFDLCICAPESPDSQPFTQIPPGNWDTGYS